MILTFVGNEKHLSNEEINEILKRDDINITSLKTLSHEKMNRNKW